MTTAFEPQSHDNEPDPTPEELELIRKATPAEQDQVDALLIRTCSVRWQKVATVVGRLLDEFEGRFAHLPYVYLQVRLLELRDRGLIDARGNVMQMRASEIRLVVAPKAA